MRRSLSQGSGTRQQPIRPDGRTATQFRPLTAEAGGSILPGTNGSARVCFADGTEAVAGVKCEIERTVGANVRDLWGDRKGGGLARKAAGKDEEDEEMMEGGDVDEDEDAWKKGSADWVEISVEIPGCRDDDPGTAFLAAMLSEAVLADGGGLASRLVINRGWHWRIYLDVCVCPRHFPASLAGCRL